MGRPRPWPHETRRRVRCAFTWDANVHGDLCSRPRTSLDSDTPDDLVIAGAMAPEELEDWPLFQHLPCEVQVTLDPSARPTGRTTIQFNWALADAAGASAGRRGLRHHRRRPRMYPDSVAGAGGALPTWGSPVSCINGTRVPLMVHKAGVNADAHWRLGHDHRILVSPCASCNTVLPRDGQRAALNPPPVGCRGPRVSCSRESHVTGSSLDTRLNRPPHTCSGKRYRPSSC